VVLVVALRVELALRRRGLDEVCSAVGVRLDLTPDASTTAPRPLPASTRASFAAVQRVLARWPWGDTCLRRCLVLGQRLRRLDPAMRIGVRMTPDGDLAVHSWLHVHGRDLDTGTADFHVLRSGAVP
jgi:hypothetical protein